MCQGRDLLAKGLRWQAHNGKDIDFWKDKWIPTTPNFQVQSTRHDDDENIKVAAFINPTTEEWKIQELKRYVSKQDLKAISSIPLSKLDHPDKLIWHHSKKGIYSVKSGYHVARRAVEDITAPASSFQPHPSMWIKIWNLKIPPKAEHFW